MSGQSQTLLVVDDDPVMLQFVRGLGRRYWFEVLTAASIQEALRKLDAHPVNALLIDLHLDNGESGFALSRQLRTEKRYQDLPIGFLTGDTTLDARIEAGRSGADIYLTKNTDAEQLAASVHQMFILSRDSSLTALVVCSESFERASQSTFDEAGVLPRFERDDKQLLEQLAQCRPDTLLLAVDDFERALDLCRAVRTLPQWRELPIILTVSDWNSGRHRLSAAKVMADDCIGSPLNPTELREVLQMRTRRCAQLRSDASIDALTGLLRRESFVQVVGRKLEEARRGDYPVSIAMIDLDHFKQVNDTYGHLAGDRVLQALGHFLQTLLRPDATNGRWGGEEFCVAMTCAPEALESALGRVLTNLSSLRFESEDGRYFQSGFSAGVAWSPQEGQDLRSLVLTADARLYRAKMAGRNRIISR